MSAGCPICQEAFTESMSCVVTLCRHLFHENCLGDWIKRDSTCPTCRAACRQSTLKKLFLSFVPDDTTNELRRSLEASEVNAAISLSMSEDLKKKNEELLKNNKTLVKTNKELLKRLAKTATLNEALYKEFGFGALRNKKIRL